MVTQGRVVWGFMLAVGLIGAYPHAASAQAPAPKDATPPPPPATAVAATVNGQVIAEMAVYRGLVRANPKLREEAAKEILNYLIDNVLIDQYLTQLKIVIDAKEVDQRVEQIKVEAKKDKQDFDKLLLNLHLSEAELRKQLTSAMRWDKFVLQQGTDKVLKEFFDKNKNMFDGSQVQARHILIANRGTTAEEAKIQLAALRKDIEEESTKEVAKLPAATDNLTKEKERMKAIDKAFAAAAAKVSTCPSKDKGGDLGWFPRAGAMVEPFARAAFALKPYQMTDTVTTEFGYHLILAVDAKHGKEVKFDDVKPYVLEIYSDRLREAILAQYKPPSKIVIGAKK